VKELAGGNAAGNQWLATSLAGASATIASDALMNPFDVIKQRMQVHQSEFRSVFTALQVVYRKEGLAAFYVSYPTTLTMSIPFTAVQFTVYEHMKKLLNPSGDYSPVTHMIAGGMAGGVAAGVTTPLDVVKTLLQTRGTSHDHEIRRVGGMLDALRIIWRRDGIRGFGRGMSPRVLTHMPSNALCWLSYEFFKVAIREQ
jgi:solute carrier family 25 iron transporter 28/37